MIRNLLTLLSLMGLLLSVGAWGLSFSNNLVHIGCFQPRSGLLHHVVLVPGKAILIRDGGVGTVRSTGPSWRFGDNQFFLHVTGQSIKSTSEYTRLFRSITVPMWLPTIIFAIPVGWLVVWTPLRRRRKRKKLGLCSKCGYDLRASKDRCPECGTEFETT